MKADGM